MKKVSKISIICLKCIWKDGLNVTQFACYSEIIKDNISLEIIFLFYDLGDFISNYSIVLNIIRLNKQLTIDQITSDFN